MGNALAANPVPLVVPCHRVVRADGRFGRYSLGADANKRRLLEAEGLDVADYEALAARGVRYLGSDSTGIYCHPTCRHARRITQGIGWSSATTAPPPGPGFAPAGTAGRWRRRAIRRGGRPSHEALRVKVRSR